MHLPAQVIDEVHLFRHSQKPVVLLGQNQVMESRTILVQSYQYPKKS